MLLLCVTAAVVFAKMIGVQKINNVASLYNTEIPSSIMILCSS